MRILKWIGILIGLALGVGALGLGIARLLIDGPIAMLPGGVLGGTEVAAPEDWSFANEHQTLAVEIRPEDPYSVTTIHFVANNELYIPASRATEKKWPSMAAENGVARVGIGDSVYPVRLKRVEPGTSAWDAAFDAASEKYSRIAEMREKGVPEGVWLFHAERR